jgi:hypothetical protein
VDVKRGTLLRVKYTPGSQNAVPTSAGATVASIIGGSTVIGLVTVFVVGNKGPTQKASQEKSAE